MANQNRYPNFCDFRKGEEGKAPFGALVGFATRDFELRATNTGKAVGSTGVALNRNAAHINYVLGTSFGEDDVIFVECTGWENTAEIMNKANIRKGDQLAISGTLALDEYDGKPRVRLNVSRFQILKRKNNGQNGNSGPFEQNGNPIDIADEDLPF